MPGDHPQQKARLVRRRRSGAFRDRSGRLGFFRLSGFLAFLGPSAMNARAQDSVAGGIELFTSNEVILLAVFGGAMSFAIMSAFWMIRERSRIAANNSELKHKIADMRANNERLDALVCAADQCIVVWTDETSRPTILGKLSGSRGVPAERGSFLAFGRWLETDSAIAVEAAIRRLRGEAKSFDLALVLREGGVLEAQGRVSGSHAFVRFTELSKERSANSLLKTENNQLRATLDVIQSLFESLPHPVWIRDVAGGLYWANEAYGKSVECASGKEAVEKGIELLDPEQRRMATASQQDKVPCLATLALVVSGDRRIFDIAESSGTGGSAGMAIDRSEAEAVRRALRQTTETHAQTLDQLATAVAMFDSAQKLQFYNSSFQKLWSLADNFLAGNPTNAQVLDAIRAENRLPEFPDWRKWREEQLEIYQAMETREAWWHLPDGQTLRVIANPHNQGGATWIFENVTENLTLQSNYNALMRIQGETLDSLNEAVAVFGLDGRLKLFNPAFARFWRLDNDSLTAGTHISELTVLCESNLADCDRWTTIVEAITGFEDERDDLSGRMETVRGEIFEFNLVRLPEGQTMLALADVTAAANIERALKERNEALEQSDHLKNRFIQHVSYELRAPLTSIAGFSELLGSADIGRLNSKQAEYVGHISQSADVLTAIIDDILDLATIDAGAMALEIEQVSLGATIGRCIEDLAQTITDRGINIEIELESGAEEVDADALRLRQIVGNLLNNALSFSPDGGSVRICSARKENSIEISIADEGPGIAEENSESIFGRFEGRSAGNRRRGAGLGLSVARSFCELHGGTLDVEPGQDRGARFVCRLPRRQDAFRRAA